MSSTPYRTTPETTTRMPSGVPFIIGNEAAERFSFYGMKAILTVFMTQYLVDSSGALAVMDDEQAKGYYHLFTSAVYFTPLIGGLIADAWWGKYRTIIRLSIVYCLGHLALALDDTRVGLFLGLAMIAVGSGGIKPCVSANVGDQFGASNQHLLPKVYSWFYFSINFGSFFSTLLTPWLLKNYGPNAAFGVPGLFMLLATIVFWLGRNRFVHVPPGGQAFLRDVFGPEGRAAAARLAVIFLFVAMFWALFDQTGSAWVLQAQNMDRRWLGVQWDASQIQAANPLLIMLLIPVFSYAIYPAVDRVFRLTPLRKIAIGFWVMAAAFALSGLIETWIEAGARPNIGWQIVGYVLLTAAEVMISITCLEFAYTQAPRTMKSFVMSLYLMSVSLGNLFAAGVNFAMRQDFLKNSDGTSKLAGANYYWFFTAAIVVTAVLFIGVAVTYRGKTYIQDADGAGRGD
jgi:POT family proton-dependent oligopeptide transporter